MTVKTVGKKTKRKANVEKVYGEKPKKVVLTKFNTHIRFHPKQNTTKQQNIRLKTGGGLSRSVVR